MLETINLQQRYRSSSGYLFLVTGFAQHAQDCSIRMILYVNLEPTFDAPAGTQWVIEESLFLKRFTET